MDDSAERDESLGIIVGGPALRRNRTRLFARIALAVVVLAALAVAGRRYYGELERLTRVSGWIVAAMALLYVTTRLPPADVLRTALVSLGHAVTRAETFFLLMVQYYVNMLIPRAGIGALAGYFKLRRGVTVAEIGAAQLLLLTLVQFAWLGPAALACQLALAAAGLAPLDPVLAIVFAAVGLGSLLPLVVPLPRWVSTEESRAESGLLSRFLSRLSVALRELGRDRRLILRAVAAHAIVLFLRAWRVQLSFYAVNQPVGYWQAFVASAAADVMFLVSITPGALGFREGGMVYAARVLGTTGDIALAAAVLDRIVLTGCNLVFGQIGMWRYIARLGESRMAKPE